MQDKERKISDSLREELKEVRNLLDKALTQAQSMENQYYGKKTPSTPVFVSDPNSEDLIPVDENPIITKPSNWDNLKNNALEESVQSMEDDGIELTQNTKQVRDIKKKSQKLKLDDNWEDDPF